MIFNIATSGYFGSMWHRIEIEKYRLYRLYMLIESINQTIWKINYDCVDLSSHETNVRKACPDVDSCRTWKQRKIGKARNRSDSGFRFAADNATIALVKQPNTISKLSKSAFSNAIVSTWKATTLSCFTTASQRCFPFVKTLRPMRSPPPSHRCSVQLKLIVKIDCWSAILTFSFVKIYQPRATSGNKLEKKRRSESKKLHFIPLEIMKGQWFAVFAPRAADEKNYFVFLLFLSFIQANNHKWWWWNCTKRQESIIGSKMLLIVVYQYRSSTAAVSCN